MTPQADRHADLIGRAISEALSAPEGLAPPDFFDAATELFRKTDREDHDVNRAVYGLLETEFGFLRLAAAGIETSEDDWRRLVGSIRGLIDEFGAYDPMADDRIACLRMLTAVTSYLGGTVLWPLLPASIGENTKLLVSLAQVIKSQAFELQTFDRFAPIAMQRAIDTLKRADANDDWEAISELFPRLPPPITGHLAPQAIQCLARYDFQRLVDANAGIGQIVPARMAVETLKTDDAVRLAAQTQSLKLKFASMFHLFGGRGRPLSAETEMHVVQMLTDLSTDDALWRSWMWVFNRYPVRFPGLQQPLGKALARMNPDAVARYVESVDLHVRPHDERKFVATCLETFHAHADLPRRQALWSVAHRRWRQWDFDAANSEMFLSEPSWSALDFAVVGYFVECTTDAEKKGMESSILAEIGRLDREWFPSFTAFLTARNRFLSRLQPVAHADAVISGVQPWLAEKHQYGLADDRTDYSGKKCRIG